MIDDSTVFSRTDKIEVQTPDTTKKISIGNVPQKFKESLKKFEYVEPVALPMEKETGENSQSKKEIVISRPPEARTLSREQQEALDRFSLGENLFVTGPGGTGKTHLIKLMVQHAHAANKPLQVCALTGCAAVLLQSNARTIHSWSGIKLAKGPAQKIIGNVLKNRTATKAWITTQILIIDEISMMSRKIFDILNKIGQTLRNNPRPFGGIQVVFCGDFFQLGPIGEMEEPETGMFCFESDQWFSTFPLDNHIELKTIFRQRDPAYMESGKPIENMVLDKCDRLTMMEREREIDLMMMSNNMPTTLDLKVGAAVMCTANLDLDKGICNGSQGVVVEILGTGPHRQPKVKFTNGVIFLMPVHFVQSDEYPTLAIGQIPLTLAWALTIHKIQGATLAMAQMDIGQTIFEYGQTYVALSRIQSLDGLYLSSFEPGRIRANPKVQDFYGNLR